jgi:hypothetical protein
VRSDLVHPDDRDRFSTTTLALDARHWLLSAKSAARVTKAAEGGMATSLNGRETFRRGGAEHVVGDRICGEGREGRRRRQRTESRLRLRLDGRWSPGVSSPARTLTRIEALGRCSSSFSQRTEAGRVVQLARRGAIQRCTEQREEHRQEESSMSTISFGVGLFAGIECCTGTGGVAREYRRVAKEYALMAKEESIADDCSRACS